jgi:O-antigen/teichoic acid export membrane protein
LNAIFLKKIITFSQVENDSKGMSHSKILKNTVWLIFDKLVKVVSGLVGVVLVANYLGPEDYGKIQYLLGVLSIVIATSSLGMKEIVVREFVRVGDKGVIINAIFVRLISSVGLYLILLSYVYLASNVDIIFILLSSVLILKANEPIKYYFEAITSYRKIVILESVTLVIGGCFKIFFIQYEYGITYIILAILLESALVFIFLINVFYKYISTRFFRYINLNISLKLILDSWPLLLSSVLITLSINIDKIFINHLSGLIDVGVYSVSTQIYFLMQSFIVAYEVSSYPKAFEYRKKMDAINFIGVIYSHIFKLQIGLVILWFFIGIHVFDYLYSEDYSDAKNILSMILCLSLSVVFFRAYDVYMKSVNKQKKVLYRQLFIVLLNMPLNYFLIPIYGNYGAVVATFLPFLILLPYALFVDKDAKELRVMFYRIYLKV